MPSPPGRAADFEIILDLSRLLSRLLHPTPTGIDRVELAYARELLAVAPERLRFAAVHPIGVYGHLPLGTVRRFLDAVEDRWEHRGDPSAWERRRFAMIWAARLLPRLRLRRARDGKPRIYLQPSPNNLTRPKLIESILRLEGARFVCLIHDLIPLEYPEYARADGARLHRERIRTIVRHADGILANSQATLSSLEPWIERSGRKPATAVAHLGTEAGDPPAPRSGQTRPYFVCIGTIEPRKNHLLLLNAWRRLAERDGPNAVPKLILVGRRGWENEQVVDMLERCPYLVDCVEEQGRLPDRDVRTLLAGARALLMPSFAEGYGMPISEALTLGVPIVCSDLPALREAGGGVPHYLDPLDGLGWLAAIDDLSHPESNLAKAQAERRADWRPGSWQEHIAIVLNLLHKLAA